MAGPSSLPEGFDERTSAEMRSIARATFLHALAESSISRAFEANVSNSRGVLRICDDLYDLSAYSRVFV
ncbi:MAG: hypothetical protein JOY79_06910, partial [Acidobacteriaceae bacterium]|nr:hypothetical protein [Acidobacteriaceae bacterium]